jgi:hypothetical protein
MRNIQLALGRGHVAREDAARTLLTEIVSTYEKLLNPRLIADLEKVIRTAFPRSKFVEVAVSTKGVYERSLAPKNKFDEPTYRLELALIDVSSGNASAQAISRLQTQLAGALLRKAARAPSWWLRTATFFWSNMGAPVLKWAIPVAGGALLAYFGLRHGV